MLETINNPKKILNHQRKMECRHGSGAENVPSFQSETLRYIRRKSKIIITPAQSVGFVVQMRLKWT